MRFSIIIPVLNEAGGIQQTLQSLQKYKAAGHEVILADGGSSDDTRAIADKLVSKVIISSRGRARQMNAGADVAQGDILLFLHADTVIGDNVLETIAGSLERTNKKWGRCNVRLSGSHRWFRLIERMMNYRSCLTGIATGDQAMFVYRDAFHGVNGFDNIPLMEDVALSKKLKYFSRPLCIKEKVITSSRRWEEHGVWATIFLMWRLRLAYFFGADPQVLADSYRASGK